MTATDVYESPELAHLDRAQQRAAHIDLAYTTLGYEQLPQRENGMVVGFVWVQRHAEQIRGLPAALVEQARASIAREQQTRQALMTAYGEARQYIQKHNLSDQAARVKVELMSAEAATAHREAGADTQRAMLALGQLVERVNAARQVLSSAPEKRAAIEQQAAQLLAALDQQEQAARQALASLGATE